MKFEKEEIDLTLEFFTIDGVATTLESTLKTNAENVINVMTQWSLLEDLNEKRRKADEEALKLDPEAKPTVENAFIIYAKELAVVYEHDYKWFMANVSGTLMAKLVTHVAGAVAGIKKKEVN